MPDTDPITGRSALAVHLAAELADRPPKATASPAPRPMFLVAAEPDGTVAAIWRMPAHSPGGLVRQVAEMHASREVSPEVAGLETLDPAAWYLIAAGGEEA